MVTRPRSFHDIQSESRAEQEAQERLSRYALRAAVKGTINEFVNGHGMRRLGLRQTRWMRKSERDIAFCDGRGCACADTV
ncbi:hypothetical protein [Actinacidiphila sp. bgisy144]|uniref:hypothetical protein n=1 Tax=Actinacidiphila sp. bgisy144 TaxID=3413791 RepID=UPI003EB8B025